MQRHTGKMFVLAVFCIAWAGIAQASSLIVSNFGMAEPGPILTVSIQNRWIQGWNGTAAGFAHENGSSTVYLQDPWSQTLLARAVTNLNDDTNTFPYFGDLSAGYLDMAWAGTSIWAADSFQNKLDKIDPTNGSYNPADSISLDFQPTGVAFDGTDFWVSENIFDGELGWLGSNLWKLTSSGGVVLTHSLDYAVGGLAFENGTLFVGSSDGIIQALDAGDFTPGIPYSTDGSRFVGGLEVLDNFETVPEPGTYAMFGGALLVIGYLRRRATSGRA